MKDNIIETLIKELELPDSAYDKAVNRYIDLGKWLSREDSSLKDFDPYVFSQGSFRLGTAIKPEGSKDEYDLDLACKLRSGVSKTTHSQKELKEMIKVELDLYQRARNIQEEVEEKHRCLRIEYQDELKFHIDIVPCIPESQERIDWIYQSLAKFSSNTSLAESYSRTTVSITDNRTRDYESISDNWNISNPEGYAKWFEQRMRQQASIDLSERDVKIDDVPLYKRKTPLQRAIQLLKKHRDIMFSKDLDSKPISIIITTLASKAYSGETDISDLMNNIFQKIPDLVSKTIPRIPNPVDNEEDFADRWTMPEYSHLNLEKNFWAWYEQAKFDFYSIQSSLDTKFITKIVSIKFGINLDESQLKNSLTGNSSNRRTPTQHNVERENRPWRRE